MINKLFKKSLLTILVLILVLFLAACGADESGSGEEGGNEEVELTLWAWPGFGIADLAAQYEEENPGITINIQESEYGAVHENLITSLASGSGAPDISAVDEGYTDRFLQNPDHFHNLFDLGGRDLEGMYLDYKWEKAVTPDDEFLLGVPTDIGPMVMMYREDIYEEAGLPTDPDEVAAQLDTWEKFIEAGRTVKEETGVNMINRITDLYLAILEQGSPQYFNEQDEFVGDESEQNIRAWDLASHATDISANVERDTTEWATAMANGDIATVFLPPWMFQNIKNAAPETAGLWNVTLMPEGSGNFGGSYLTLPAQGDHPEEAYDFATWVMAPEQQLEIFKNSGPFPSTPEVYDDPAIQELQDDFVNNPNLGALYAEAAEQIVPSYKGIMHDPISQMTQDALISIEDGQATPEEAWNTAVEEAKRQLERQ